MRCGPGRSAAAAARLRRRLRHDVDDGISYGKFEDGAQIVPACARPLDESRSSAGRACT
jgi:hypothetical protein